MYCFYVLYNVSIKCTVAKKLLLKKVKCTVSINHNAH